jgi:hypothetical protein
MLWGTKMVLRSLLVVCAISATSMSATVCAADLNDPTGTWVWSRELEGQTNRSVLKLVHKNGTLTGTYRRTGQTVPIANGKFEKGEVSFDAEGMFDEQKIRAKFHGKLSENEINGNIDVVIEDNSLPLPWTAKRGLDLEAVAGTWKLKLENSNGNAIEPTLKLAVHKETLKGTYTGRFGEQPARELKLEGNQLSWQVLADRDGRKFKGAYKAKLDGNSLKGNLEFDLGGNSGTLAFTGERQQPKADAGKPVGSIAPTGGDQASGRAIVSLKGRDEIVTVHYLGVRRVTFSIFSRQGQPIASDISLKTLQATYPQIYRAYRMSYADAWATKD